MCNKGKNKSLCIWMSLLAGLVLLSVAGCDSILPEDFQSKDYKVSGAEKTACYWLSLPDSLYDLLATKVTTRTLRGCLAVADTALAHLTDNQIIAAAYDRIADSLNTLVSDSLMLVYYPAGEDTVYAVLNVAAGQAGSLGIYESLEYYYRNDPQSTNINEFVTVELLTADTSRVSSSSALPVEALSGCSKQIMIAQHERVIPIIREGYQVQLASGVYLVRFILTNAVTIAPFIGESNNRDYYFKIVIL